MNLFRTLLVGFFLTFVSSAQASVELATFTVTKDFTDDNTAGVQVYIECTTGDPISSDAVVYEFDPVFDKVEFIVGDYDEGELDCIIFEDVPDGYTVDYEASAGRGEGGEAGSIADSDDDVDGCRFLEVVGGDFYCEITNELQQVRVTVDKVWVDDLAAENGAFLFAGAEWECDPVATLNDPPRSSSYPTPDSGQLTFHGTPAIPWDYDTFYFWPHFEGSDCSVTEREFDSDIISDDSDCDDLEIFPGHDLGLREDTKIPVADCTILNTRIYAGIPTLSEYGLALLALLMLGIGFVSFRRFT